MFGGDRDLDTICAISTPPGIGGIHVIRISGNSALKITRPFAPFLPDKMESHRVYYGTLVSEQNNLEPIDEVLVTYFRHGSSFTGEETIEIACHGSPYIAQQIIKMATLYGSRLADRGEFTYRAFLNGKIDLIQAESVLSLIQSENEKSLKVAINQLKGGLSSKLKTIETDIIALLARLEVSIDFTTEDIEIISNSEIIDRVDKIQSPIDQLLKSFRSGQKIQSGFEVILVGEPNVGKSSLLNRVLFEERAIVTDIPGTTRDLIQEQINVKGVKVTLIDSAGIRETEDVIEKMGVSKTREAIERADLVLAVFDSAHPNFQGIVEQLPSDLSKILFVGNKVDLITPDQRLIVLKELQNLLLRLNKFQNLSEAETFLQKRSIFTSAKSRSENSVPYESKMSDANKLVLDSVPSNPKNGSQNFGMDSQGREQEFVVQQQILNLLETHLDTGSFGDEAILFQARHYENLQRTSECLLRARLLAKSTSSPEFLALEIKEVLIRIQEILGERFDDQVLDRVFSEFCIGK